MVRIQESKQFDFVIIVGFLSLCFLNVQKMIVNLLGTVVLGDSLGSLRDGVLGQLTGEDEADGGLDLLGADGGALVVRSELAGLRGDALKNVIDKRVHNAHGLLRNVHIGVALAEDLEDVGRVRLVAGALAASGCGRRLFGGLGGSLASGFLCSGSHCCCC